MRLYRKLWEKRLRQNITLDERQKGFVLVDGLQYYIPQKYQKRINEERSACSGDMDNQGNASTGNTITEYRDISRWQSNSEN